MRKAATVAGVTVGAILITMVLGQEGQTTDRATIKFGVINSQLVLQQTQEGQRELLRFNEILDQKRKDQDAKSAELQRLQEQFNNQRRTLNPDTGAEMQREIARKKLELERLQQDDQIEVQELQQEAFNRIAGKLQEIVTDYGQKNGYGLILQRNESQVYVGPGLEITQDIIRIYNEKYPVAGTTP